MVGRRSPILQPPQRVVRAVRALLLALAVCAGGGPADAATRVVAQLADEAVIERASRAETLATGRRRGTSAEGQAYRAHLDSEQDAFVARAMRDAPGVRVRARLRDLANAVSLEVAEHDVAVIAALPGVRRVERVRPYHLHLSLSVPRIGAAGLAPAPGDPPLSGDGVTIAVVDSGIDIANPFFVSDAAPPEGFPRGDARLTNGKVIVAKAFLGDPAATAADENGHGTNIASIAAGNTGVETPLGVLRGVAPAAALGNYRAFDRRGAGSNDLIARAIEEAFRDGFDVANLSFGSQASRTEDQFLLDTIANAVAGGMVVVVSAGNSGPGRGTIDTPGVSGPAITVASATNGHTFGTAVRVAAPTPVPPAVQDIAARPGFGSVISLPTGVLPFTDVAAIPGGKRGCRRLAPGALAGRIGLVERGGCAFRRKLRTLAAAGAVAAVVYNDGRRRGGGDRLVDMDVVGAPIPGAFVGRTGGLALRERVASVPDSVLRFDSSDERPLSADVVSGFSARGPSLFDQLKPDLTAPGDAVYGGALTAGPTTDGVADAIGFAAASGTSQAAAHVSGVAALLRQGHPAWSPEQIKSALMASALPATNGRDPAGVLDAGAGRIDVAGAAAVPVTVSPPSISVSLVRRRGGDRVTVPLRIVNVTDGSVTLSLATAPDTGSPPLTVEPLASSVTLAAGATAEVAVAVAVAGKARRVPHTALLLLGTGATTLRVPVLALPRRP